mmetsp:Transcript_13027/g.26927  ORF Transcript_13027/g.26927 Transcript_13027/m.26927 type:complete len:315 (-) Transcript_13027:1848-2792(-)
MRVRNIISPFVGVNQNKHRRAVLVLGGSGVIGHRVASRLLASDDPPKVRVAVRGEDEVPDLVNKGAEVVEFAWEDADTYAAALTDVQSVLCITSSQENWIDSFPPFLRACKRAGVRHFVKLSFYHSLAPSSDPFTRLKPVHQHRICDVRLLKAHRLNYTILMASHFMSNPLRYQAESLLNDGEFYGNSLGQGVNYVSPNDVADVAVHAILAPKEHRRTGYTLTGPEAITDEEVSVLLSNQLHERIKYKDVSIDEYSDPSLADLERIKGSGLEDTLGFVDNDIERACGRPAQTFEEYLAATDEMSPKELVAFETY